MRGLALLQTAEDYRVQFATPEPSWFLVDCPSQNELVRSKCSRAVDLVARNTIPKETTTVVRVQDRIGPLLTTDGDGRSQ